jgi:hypothetical protein
MLHSSHPATAVVADFIGWLYIPLHRQPMSLSLLMLLIVIFVSQISCDEIVGGGGEGVSLMAI